MTSRTLSNPHGTERPRAAVQTVELLRILEAIAWDINSELANQDILHRIVDSVTEHSPWSACWAGLFDLDADRVTLWAGSSPWWDDMDHVLRAMPVSGSPSALAIERDRALSIPDVAIAYQFPRIREDTLRRGLGCILVIPLHVRSECGVLWLCGSHPHEFRPAEIAFGTVLASLAAIALNNSRLLSTERTLLNEQQTQVRELARLHGLATQQNDALRRRDQIHNRLVSLVLSNGGPHAIVDNVAMLASLPVVVLDQFGAPIATSPEASSEQAIHNFKDAMKGPLAAHSAQLGRAGELATRLRDWIAAPIAAGGALLGYLGVVNSDPSRTDDLRLLVEQACPLLAIEMYKEQIRFEAELHARHQLTDILARTDLSSDAAIRYRASLLNVDISRPHVVLRASCSHSGAEPEPGSHISFAELASLSRAVTHRLHRFSAIVVPLSDTDWVVILPKRTASSREMIAEFTDVFRKIMGELLPSVDDDSTNIGIGDLDQGPQGLQRSFEQARVAAQILTLLGSRGKDLMFADADAYSILLSVPRDQQEAYCARLLGSLREYDREHDSELGRTLNKYLDCLGNVSRTAAELYIHSTTVRYRLERIETILGRSLSDSNTWIAIQLALHLERLHRR